MKLPSLWDVTHEDSSWFVITRLQLWSLANTYSDVSILDGLIFPALTADSKEFPRICSVLSISMCWTSSCQMPSDIFSQRSKGANFQVDNDYSNHAAQWFAMVENMTVEFNNCCPLKNSCMSITVDIDLRKKCDSPMILGDTWVSPEQDSAVSLVNVKVPSSQNQAE